MEPNDHLALSTHASIRSAQRNLDDDQIGFIITYGNRVRRAGAIFCQLRKIDLPDDMPRNHPYHRLVGSTVVLSRCGRYVLTVYRDERAFHKDCRKDKFRRNPEDRYNFYGDFGAA